MTDNEEVRRAAFGYLFVCIVVTAGYSLAPNVLAKNICFDLFGVAAVGALLVGLRRNGEPWRLPWLILAASQLLFAVGDVTFTVYARVAPNAETYPADVGYLAGYPLLTFGLLLLVRQRAAGLYTDGAFPDQLWMLSYALLGATALHPAMRELSVAGSERQPRLRPRRLALLSGIALIAPLLLAEEAARGRSDGLSALIALSVVVFGLVLTRLSGLVLQNQRAFEREVLTRRAAAELVAAGDRDRIYRVAVETALTAAARFVDVRVALLVHTEDGLPTPVTGPTS